MADKQILLIVNADDYAYFPSVSLGILQAAKFGTVRATGIMANAYRLNEQIGWLRECPTLDAGIHLNLSSGRPLTAGLSDRLTASGGAFPGVFAMTRHILSGKIDMETIRQEWRAQIEALLDYGLRPCFLNSHEHIHMLPVLFGLALALADEYQIPHLRLTRPEWLKPLTPPAVIRNGLMQIMATVNTARFRLSAPRMLGLSCSGQLNRDYLNQVLPRLQAGQTYELMCHPGHFDPAEIHDPKLIQYHAWEGELSLLTSADFRALCDERSIRLVSYRELA